MARIVVTNSRMRSGLVWLILMRKTSAPAANSRSIVMRSEEAGPSVATTLVRRRRLIAFALPRAKGSARRRRDPAAARSPALAAEARQIHPKVRRLPGRQAAPVFAPTVRSIPSIARSRPVAPGINFEKPGAVIAAGQAVADAADGELLVANAHNGLSHPFAAAIVVDGVDIITTSPRRIPCTKPNRRTPPRVNEEAGRLARSRQQEYVFGYARKAKTGVVNVPRCGPLGGIR